MFSVQPIAWSTRDEELTAICIRTAICLCIHLSLSTCLKKIRYLPLIGDLDQCVCTRTIHRRVYRHKCKVVRFHLPKDYSVADWKGIAQEHLQEIAALLMRVNFYPQSAIIKAYTPES